MAPTRQPNEGEKKRRKEKKKTSSPSCSLPAIAMASCGFHSPRFSEDNAWLPPWLQPHRPPTLGECAKDDATVSPPSCKNCVFLGENAQQQQNCQNAMTNDGGYSGFRLHLSGDEDTPVTSTPTGGNALLFSLHLSSESTAQLSSAQANDNSRILNYHTCKGPSEEFSVDAQALQINTDSQNQAKTEGLEPYKLVEGCRAPSNEIIEPLGKHNHRRRQLSHGKVDIRKLRTADVDDAVELSIAASEAMIITEMILHGSESDHLMAAAAFETALRVKEARKQCCLEEPEQFCGSFCNDLDETDWLAELDESEMVDALDDVGLSLTQTVCSSEGHNTSNLNFRKQQAHILETCSTEKQNEELDSQDADTNDHVSDSLANHESACKLQNGLSQGFDSVKQTAIDKTVSCSRNENMALIEKSTQSTDALAGTMVALVRSQCIRKEGGDIAGQRNDGTRKHARQLFIQETSFISESMNSMGECPLTSRAESNEMIASSSTTFPYKTKGSCKINESSEDVELHHHLVCSSLSLVDPLCSVVPCSISFNEGSTSQVPKCKQTEEEGKELTYPKEALGDQILSGEAVPSCPPLAQGEKSDLEPRRRKYTSLRPYSTVMPISNILGDTTTHNKSVDSISMAIQTGDIHPTLGYSNHFRCEDAEKLPATCAFVEMVDNDIEVAVRQPERCSPLILNKKKRHIQPCNEFLNKNGEGGNLKEFPVIRKNTYHFHGSSEHCYREQPIPLDVRPQSTGHLHIGKQDLKRKRVQFLEAKHCNKQTKSGRRMQTKSRPSWSQSRMIDTLESREYMDKKEAIFQGLEFLLTGFKGQKEKEIEALIRKFGGYVLSKVPSFPLDKRSKLSEVACWKPPIVLSPKKVSTAKFLYGCATDSWILNPNWLFDSLQAGILLPPGKFLIQQRHTLKKSLRIGESLCLKNHTYIFDGVGFLIHGKISFCSKFSNVIKHGGGQVFISLQGLVQSLKDGSTSQGIILVANEASASRHLRHCGLEHNIKTAPASWIIGSLFSGKMIPFKKDRCASFRRIKMPSFPQEQAFDMSQEI